MRIAPLALALVLLAGCDAGRDADPVAAEDAPAADADAPPATVPPPVPEPDPGTDGDATVPVRFQGSYASDAAACEAPGNPTQLDIDSDSISFHESAGPILAVASGPSDVTITAELTGEGETREATYRFRLSDDAGTLTDLGSGMERVRCG